MSKLIQNYRTASLQDFGKLI